MPGGKNWIQNRNFGLRKTAISPHQVVVQQSSWHISIPWVISFNLAPLSILYDLRVKSRIRTSPNSGPDISVSANRRIQISSRISIWAQRDRVAKDRIFLSASNPEIGYVFFQILPPFQILLKQTIVSYLKQQRVKRVCSRKDYFSSTAKTAETDGA